MVSDSSVIGVVAGAGRLPVEAAQALRAQGRIVRAIAFSEIADKQIAEEVDAHRWVRLGQLAETRRAMRGLALDSALLVGKVPKSVLRGEGGLFRPDAEALALVSQLREHSDESLLGVVGRWLDQNQIRVERQDHALASMLVEVGPLSGRAASEEEKANFAAGLPAVYALGRAGNGQCVVAAEGQVIAREEEAGTDDAILRAGAKGANAATVVKAARPGQDRRFDLPAVGPGTLRTMRKTGATALALEAGTTLLIEREAFRQTADEAGIAVWGFSPPEANP